MSRRTDRINEQLREEISTLLVRQIKDPRLNAVVSITRVEASSDLRNARVYISGLGNDKAKQEALEGIQSAASFLRRELRDRLNMKHTPFLSYHLDGSIEEADQLFRLMNQINPGESAGETSDSESSPITSTENLLGTAPGATNTSVEG